MYKRRRRRHIVMPVLAGLLTLATLGSTAFAAPSFSLPQAAAYFSSILCAPNAALAATRRVLDDAMDEDAVPAAQPIDEDDPEAGFWTVGPTEEEMLPQNEAQSISSGASSVPDGPIPDGMAPLLEAHYEQGAGAGYVSSGAATVRNSTDLPDSEVAAEMMQTLPFQVELNSAEPQVLIMHTHTTETYELEEKNWCDPAFSARSTDLSVNMAAVGAEMAAQLNAAGVTTLHDTTRHAYRYRAQLSGAVSQHQGGAGRPPRRHPAGRRHPCQARGGHRRHESRPGHDHLRRRRGRQSAQF